MFGRLKKAFSGFRKKVEDIEEPTIEPIVEPIIRPSIEQTEEELPKEEKIEKKKFSLTEKRISEKNFEQLFSSFEEQLIQNNVAYSIVQKIKDKLREELVDKSLSRKQIDKIVNETLREILLDCISKGIVDLEQKAKEKKPLVILFVGVNGVGKTTTMAKVGNWFKQKGISSVFAAADTFRAAAIEQLEEHANKLDIKIIKHKYGADSAAVAFDAIEHAKARGIDVVLIDTAGRSHANTDLMDELEKVKRVSKPDLTIFVADSLTGNDAVEQAQMFADKIGIDGSILTKIDSNERGGAILSVAETTGKPILFLGVGQKYEDLKKFDAEEIIEQFLK